MREKGQGNRHFKEKGCFETSPKKVERPRLPSARPNGWFGCGESGAPSQWPFQNAFLRFFTPPLSLPLPGRPLRLPFLFGRRRCRRLARAGSRISQFASRRTRHRCARSSGRARMREPGWQRRRKFGSGPTERATERRRRPPGTPPPAWFLQASFFAKVPAAEAARAAAAGRRIHEFLPLLNLKGSTIANRVAGKKSEGIPLSPSKIEIARSLLRAGRGVVVASTLG